VTRDGQPIYARRNGLWVRCGVERCPGVFGPVRVHPALAAAFGHCGRVLCFFGGFKRSWRDRAEWWELSRYAQKQVAAGRPPKDRRRPATPDILPGGAEAIRPELALTSRRTYAVCPWPPCRTANLLLADAAHLDLVPFDPVALLVCVAWQDQHRDGRLRYRDFRALNEFWKPIMDELTLQFVALLEAEKIVAEERRRAGDDGDIIG
jgi:hypothetical protein